MFLLRSPFESRKFYNLNYCMFSACSVNMCTFVESGLQIADPSLGVGDSIEGGRQCATNSVHTGILLK